MLRIKKFRKCFGKKILFNCAIYNEENVLLVSSLSMEVFNKMSQVENAGESSKGFCFFDCLNDYCKLDVIKFLPMKDRLNFMIVSKECKRLVDLSWPSMKYLCIDNSNHCGIMCQKGLSETILSKCGPYLRFVVIREATKQNFLILNKFCQNLLCITVKGLSCSDLGTNSWESIFCSMLKNNTKLEALILHLPYCEEYLLEISSLKSLRSLNMTFSSNLNDTILSQLAYLRNFTEIQNFQLHVSVFEFDGLLRQLVCNLPNITGLCISCELSNFVPREFFEELIFSCKNIRSFCAEFKEYATEMVMGEDGVLTLYLKTSVHQYEWAKNSDFINYAIIKLKDAVYEKF